MKTDYQKLLPIYGKKKLRAMAITPDYPDNPKFKRYPASEERKALETYTNLKFYKDLVSDSELNRYFGNISILAVLHGLDYFNVPKDTKITLVLIEQGGKCKAALTEDGIVKDMNTSYANPEQIERLSKLEHFKKNAGDFYKDDIGERHILQIFLTDWKSHDFSNPDVFNTSVFDQVMKIYHEMTHMVQNIRGDLIDIPNAVHWKPTGIEMPMPEVDALHDKQNGEYELLPWEMEANVNAFKLAKAFAKMLGLDLRKDLMRILGGFYIDPTHSDWAEYRQACAENFDAGGR